MTPSDESPLASVLRSLAARAGQMSDNTAGLGWQPTKARADRVARGVAGAEALPGDLVTAVTTLATPAETLLLLGGDDRVIPVDGVNSYGFPIADTAPAALLSSCTASPPGATDLAVVETWRNEHLAELLAGQHSKPPADWRAPTAHAIATMFGLDGDDVRRLVLTPSGTDAEVIAAAIAVYSHGRPVVNVVVGAHETGSGTLRAAAGLATTSTTPLGETSTPGTAIDGLGPDLIRVVDVDVRDARGRARRPFDVEAEVEAHVEAALHDGATVLVHSLACSKTGLEYLEPEWVATWRARYPGMLRVIVDAAQTRTSRARLQAYLAAGASVVATGSKALSGAPFSGVLVLDDALLSDAESCDRLPAGLANLLSVADLPDHLARLALGWEPVNLGLLARWQTAIAQHAQYLAIDPRDRQVWRTALIDNLRSGLAGVDEVDVLPEMVPSLISFTVSGAAGPAGREPLTQLHHVIAAQRVYLGQPAELMPGGTAVLRAAVGLATLTSAALAPDPLRFLRELVATTVAALREALQDRAHVT